MTDILASSIGWARMNSPKILLGAGLVSMGVGAGLACKATLKAADRQKALTTEKVDINDYYCDDEEEAKRVMRKAEARALVDILKIYRAPAAFFGGGVLAVLGGFKILDGRLAAAGAAYAALSESFMRYRQNVIEDKGEEKDLEYKLGLHKEKEKVEGEEGKKHTEERDVVDPNKISVYARFYDESCSEWCDNAEYNLSFLKTQQQIANDILHARGHIFLNEVYDMLGIPRSQEGQRVGWALGNGDDFVDFGIYDVVYRPRADFVNGYEPVILLDFNVDGVIDHLI